MNTVLLLGRRVGGSLSPAMHAAAFRALGLDWDYLPLSFEAADLPRVVEAIRLLELPGANVTVPYKEAVIPLLDGLSPEAARCGSVNTLVRDGVKLVGHSTDGQGFLRACRFHDIPLRGAKVLLLGAGGAARAVAFALLDAGAGTLAVANRDPERGRLLAAALAAAGARAAAVPFCPPDPATVAAADVLVNATPLGSAEGDSTPLSAALLRPGQRAVDLLYASGETPFMAAARSAGAKACNGLAMLLFQGVAAQRLWTGLEPPAGVMAVALCAAAGVPDDSLTTAG